MNRRSFIKLGILSAICSAYPFDFFRPLYRVNISFIGSGIDLSEFYPLHDLMLDGEHVREINHICYGTHTVTFLTRNKTSKFDILGFQKPRVPVGAKETSRYFLIGNEHIDSVPKSKGAHVVNYMLDDEFGQSSYSGPKLEVTHRNNLSDVPDDFYLLESGFSFIRSKA